MGGHIDIFGIGILSWVTWLPALGAIFLLFFSRTKNDQIRWFANLWIVLCFLISVPLVTGFGSSKPGYDRALNGLQFIEDHEWIPLIGARYQLGVDGLSLVLVMLTTLLGVVSVICSWSYIREKGREKEYYVMLMLLQSGMIGAFVAADLFLFFVFWEVMLVPMYFLIGIWGGKNRLYSAIKFFLYTLVGSVVMLLAVLKLFFIFPDVVQAQRPAVEARARTLATSPVTGQINERMLNLMEDAIKRTDPAQIPQGYVNSSFNIAALTAAGPSIGAVMGLGVVIWLFIGFALSFAIKVPMFPFHTWLPDAHYDAPTAGSVILAGVLLKMGTYGFMRFSLPIFPEAATHPTVRRWMISPRDSRNNLRRAGRDGAKGREEADRLLFGFAPRICDAGTILAQPERDKRRGVADDKSRHLHGRALYAGRYSLRAAAHLRDRGVRRARSRDADFFDRLSDRHFIVARAPADEQLHRRVPDPQGRVRGELGLGGVCDRRHHPRRGLHAVAVPARLLRPVDEPRKRESALT